MAFVPSKKKSKVNGTIPVFDIRMIRHMTTVRVSADGNDIAAYLDPGNDTGLQKPINWTDFTIHYRRRMSNWKVVMDVYFAHGHEVHTVMERNDDLKMKKRYESKFEKDCYSLPVDTYPEIIPMWVALTERIIELRDQRQDNSSKAFVNAMEQASSGKV